MADKVIGKNIMLYTTSYSAKYILNGGIDETTISGVPFKQLSTTANVASTVYSNISGNGLVAGFITDIGNPNVTTLKAGTWTVSNHMGLYNNLSGAPKYYITVFKYNGTTLTALASSATYALVDIGAAHLYTTDIVMPAVTLASTDRIAIGFYAVDVDTRTLQVYSQGIWPGSITTTLPADVPFACSTNCTFQVDVDQKEVTSVTSAWYKEYKNDVATWSISCDGLITLDNYGYLFLLKQQQNRETILVKFVIDNGVDGLVIISGYANLSSMSLNAPYKDIGTYNVSLQGTGAYATTGTTINSSGVVIVGGGSVMYQYTAVGSETTVTFAGAIGKDCLDVTRGGIDVREILTSGVPTGDQVSWNSLTGVLTFGRALEADEFIRGIFN